MCDVYMDRPYQIFEECSFPLALVDAKTGKFLDFNREFLTLLNYSKKELSKMNIGDILESPSKVKKGRFETRYRTKKGKKIDIEINVNLIKKDGKKAALCFCTDITERKKMEKLLVETNRKIGEKMQSMEFNRELLYSANKKLNEMNRELGKEKQRRDKEISQLIIAAEKIGHGDFEYKLHLNKTAELKQLADVLNRTTQNLKESMRLSQEAVLNAKEKEQTIQQYAANLRSTVDQLKEVNRLKTNFLSIASHELKTPLTPITIQLQLLDSYVYGDLNRKQREIIEVVLRNVKRLDILIKDIAVSSRIVRGRLELTNMQTDLGRVVYEVVETFDITAKKRNIKCETKIEENIPTIFIDREKLRRVLVNLVNNAIKFNRDGGKVLVTLGYSAKERHISLSVKDTGIGIPKNKVSKLFTQFFQVESSRARKYGGSGLGLYICKEIIERMGGRIAYKGKAGKGSTFTFTIPVKPVKLGKRKLSIEVEDVLARKYKFPALKLETGAKVKRLTRTGLVSEDGRIKEGLRLKDIKGKFKFNYPSLAWKIIQKASEILHAGAYMRANEVKGLRFKQNKVTIHGNGYIIVTALLEKYSELLGYLAENIEQEAVRETIREYLLGGRVDDF